MKNKISKLLQSKLFIVISLLAVVAITITAGTMAWFTWNSTDNASLTMSIGNIAKVTFTGGPDINTDDLTPVFDYEDGEKVSVAINNVDQSGAALKHSIVLNLNLLPEFLQDPSFKYKLFSVQNDTKAEVTSGDFSEYAEGESIILVDGAVLSTGITNYEFVIYIDANMENSPNMANQTFSGSLTVRAEEYITPLSDFEYEIGGVTEFKYTDAGTGTITNIIFGEENTSCVPITLDDSRIVLKKYIGSSSTVSIPTTYTINDITYNVTLLSAIKLQYQDALTNYEINSSSGVFYGNNNITFVTMKPGLGFLYVTSDSYYEKYADYLFYKMDNLVTVNGLENQDIVDMFYSLKDCTSLINISGLPRSDTNLTATFSGCTSLVNAPEIPEGITSMVSTFFGCTSLVNAPEIPENVTRMMNTFNGCTSLSGNVVINSSNIANAVSTFKNTTLPITVIVPKDSTTYTTFSSTTMPSNVTIMAK